MQLMFDTMNIRSCSDCSCGYVQVRDGSGSSSQLLGTFCDTNNPSVVSSTGNHMFIKFMSRDSWDFFGATIISKESEGTFALIVSAHPYCAGNSHATSFIERAR